MSLWFLPSMDSKGIAQVYLLIACGSLFVSHAQGIGDYEYFYDELPSGYYHQSRNIRESPIEVTEKDDTPPQRDLGSHIQLVPAFTATTTLSPVYKNVQRIPANKKKTPFEEESNENSLQNEGSTTTSSVLPEINSNYGKQKQQDVNQHEQDAEKGKDDMQTAEFFWGLGPVYPHLYYYKKVPHLVHIPGWNPYHGHYDYQHYAHYHCC